MQQRKRKSFRVEREFGIVVGLFALAMALYWWRRGQRPLAQEAAAGIGVTLILLGCAAPRLLRLPNHYWTLLAKGLSFVSTRIILAVVFFGLITPLAWIRRFVSRSKERKESFWRPYSSRQIDERHYEKMY